jgi:hypothetical protein
MFLPELDQFGTLGRTYPVPFCRGKKRLNAEKYLQFQIRGEKSPEF